MDTSSLAANVVASTAQQTRDGFQIAALKIANQQEQAVAGLVAQVADQSSENTKALTAPGVGQTVDRMA